MVLKGCPNCFFLCIFYVSFVLRNRSAVFAYSRLVHRQPSSVSEQPPSTPAGRNSFISPPHLSFPPPYPLPRNLLSPSGRSCCCSYSVTNICTLFLCSTHINLPNLTAHSPSVLFRWSDCYRHFTRPWPRMTVTILHWSVFCLVLCVSSCIRVWLTFTVNMAAVCLCETRCPPTRCRRGILSSKRLY
jgi:hypothetical protein